MSTLVAGLRYSALAMLLASSIPAQIANNQSLNGKYFFRQVSLGTDAGGNLTDARSLLGAITFDSAGHYSFTGQLVTGAGAPGAVTGNGAYSVAPAGFVDMDSPVRPGDKVNARYGPEAVIGSTTETTGSAFDLFVAIPAPTAPATPATLTGSYWAASLEFPGASFANSRNTIFNLNSSGSGTFTNFAVNGHAANLSAGQPTVQQVTGATYTMATDGTGTASFGTASTAALLSGGKTVYISKDGNILLGGTLANGSHDILIGVRALSGATNATWTGRFWGAGLRRDTSGALAYSGSAATAGTGKLLWTRRMKWFGVGNLDFTGVHSYSLNPNGSGTEELAQLALGAGGAAFIGSIVNPNDAGGYEIYFGLKMPAVSGTGLWIDPQRVENPVSFSPTGNPISPGDFIRVYGSGLPPSTTIATPPYPPSLNGVSVLVSGKSAPIYAVTAGTVDFLVPFDTQGPSASIVVQNAGASSNTVTVPVAATSPGVLTLQQSGSGPAVMQHTDYSVVTSDHPAVGGETILIYITGLGTVTPALADGVGGGANPPSSTVAQPVVLIGGKPGNVLFSGLTAYPGLYQINVTLPPNPPGVSSLPLAIITPNAYHDQVDIPVQP